MEKTLTNFIAYLHSQVGVSCYVWGGQGEVCSDELIKAKEKNGPGSASTVAKNTKRALNFVKQHLRFAKKRCFRAVFCPEAGISGGDIMFAKALAKRILLGGKPNITAEGNTTRRKANITEKALSIIC